MAGRALFLAVTLCASLAVQPALSASVVASPAQISELKVALLEMRALWDEDLPTFALWNLSDPNPCSEPAAAAALACAEL